MKRLENYNLQEKKDSNSLSKVLSGGTKQGGINSQDDTKLHFPERSASLPVDTPLADKESEEIKFCKNIKSCLVRKIKRINHESVYCWGEDMKNCETYQYYQRNNIKL